LDPRAVERVFEIKGRPANNPIIVHIGSIELAQRCVASWPPIADVLAQSFWPGPLTLVLPRSPSIPENVTAGGPTVGVRWPSHPLIQAVINRCGFPLAAPSANPASRTSPTTAEHVLKYFGEAISLIVDGGRSQVGIESTVLDLSATPPRLLRPGMIHAEVLQAVIGELAVASGTGEQVLKSPGLLAKHYAPKAKLFVWNWQNDESLVLQIASAKLRPETCHVIAHSRIPSSAGWAGVSVIPHDAEAFARAIYAEIHRCDEMGVKHIIVEAPPPTGEWHAITDRLRRAAS
jgi:L-threonylcarbamoyladenylate synthase